MQNALSSRCLNNIIDNMDLSDKKETKVGYTSTNKVGYIKR